MLVWILEEVKALPLNIGKCKKAQEHAQAEDREESAQDAERRQRVSREVLIFPLDSSSIILNQCSCVVYGQLPYTCK